MRLSRLICTAILTLACSSTTVQPTPPARLEHTMIYDPVRHQVLLYGGMSGGVALGDLWAWNGSSWTELASGGPPARFAAVLGWDPASSRVLMYGGTANGTHLTDTWSWDGTAWNQAPSPPGPGLGHAAGGWDAARGRLVVHRGYSGTAPERDTWEWDGTQWSQVSTTVPIAFAIPLPSPMVYDPVRNALLMLIGDADTKASAIWTWNGSAWSTLTTPPALEPPAALALLATNDLLAVNGSPSAGATVATWRWNGATWTDLGISGPPKRFVARMAYDPGRNQVVLFGGMTASGGSMGDTWIWDGTAWTEQ